MSGEARGSSRQAGVDTVTVAYNSAGELRHCIEPLSRMDRVNPIVVDNSSTDGSLETIANLRATTIRLEANGGFAHGCNVGWRSGRLPYVLFINPDAVIEATTIDRLVAVLEGDPTAGAVAPKIVNSDGTSAYSARRFPRLISTFAQAIFLHRLFPTAAWTDELIRDERFYEKRSRPDWVSGACLLVRRSVLEELDGWDERFFLFGEDIDLCRRISDMGHTLWFEPDVTCAHIGGTSAPKATALPLLTAGRLKYIELHHGRVRLVAEHVGMSLGAALRVLVGRRGARRAQLRSLLVALGIPWISGTWPLG